jgi:hypothetical protein
MREKTRAILNCLFYPFSLNGRNTQYNITDRYDPENRGSKFLRNFAIYLNVHTQLQPRRITFISRLKFFVIFLSSRERWTVPQPFQTQW